VELVVIDQLSKIEPALKGIDFERQTARMRSVTSIIKHLAIPVILLCQLSRAADDARGGLMSALKSTGQIEEDAHVLIFLHEAPVQSDKAKAGYNDEREMHIIIPKNGGGPKGRFRMLFNPKQCLFSEISDRFESSRQNESMEV
jgi:replicative DNA helicase